MVETVVIGKFSYLVPADVASELQRLRDLEAGVNAVFDGGLGALASVTINGKRFLTHPVIADEINSLRRLASTKQRLEEIGMTSPFKVPEGQALILRPDFYSARYAVNKMSALHELLALVEEIKGDKVTVIRLEKGHKASTSDEHSQTLAIEYLKPE